MVEARIDLNLLRLLVAIMSGTALAYLQHFTIGADEILRRLESFKRMSGVFLKLRVFESIFNSFRILGQCILCLIRSSMNNIAELTRLLCNETMLSFAS